MIKSMSDKTYHIVVSRWGRNTEWTLLFPQIYNNLYDNVFTEEELNTKCKLIIYDKECSTNPYNVPINKGNEASVYLKYIIDHYEIGIADRVFFIHDEEYSWHHSGSLYDRFKEALIIEKPFYNINDFTMQSLFTNIYAMELLKWYIKYVEPYIALESLPNPDFTIGHKGAAQFMVNKEAILNLPKCFYEDLYDWVMNSGESSFVTGRFLEWTWHIFWDLHR